MPKKNPGDEVFVDRLKELTFSANFGFMTAVNSYGTDIAEVYNDFLAGNLSPLHIRNILVSAMGDHEGSKEEYIEGFIERHGLQECGIVAYRLISHSCIGNAKESALAKGEVIKAITDHLISSPLMSLRKVGLLWISVCLISTLLACGISSVLNPHTCLKTELMKTHK